MGFELPAWGGGGEESGGVEVAEFLTDGEQLLAVRGIRNSRGLRVSGEQQGVQATGGKGGEEGGGVLEVFEDEGAKGEVKGFERG